MDKFIYDENIEYDSDDVRVYDPRRTGHIKNLDIRLSMGDLDSICKYVMKIPTKCINTACLMNAKIFFDILNKKYYSNNDELSARIEFIQLTLTARLSEELENKETIKKYVLRNCKEEYKEIIESELINDILMMDIDDNTCRFLNKTIYEDLISGYVKTYTKRLKKILEREEEGSYKSPSEFAKDFKKMMLNFYEDMSDSERFQKESSEFDLSEETMTKKINGYIDQFTAPSNKLKTGIQFLNKMLNGGFESGRSYLFMGITGTGKSVILLSIALWIMKFNELPNDDGMKQTVLFISQENSELETVERIFNMTVTPDDIRNVSASYIINSLKEAGIIMPKNNKTGINFKFVYRADKEIGVTDIDNMITEYEKQGIKVVAVIQDYIEKLCPKHRANELRTSLGNIATELSELAKKYNIPVISAAQLNRNASTSVDKAVDDSKSNTTKLLGKKDISESWDVMKNVDAAIIINREFTTFNDEKQEYLGFKLEKLRGRPSKDKITYFIHPFEENNAIALETDIDKAVPLSKLKIEDFNPMQSRVTEYPTKNSFINKEDKADDIANIEVDEDESPYVDIESLPKPSKQNVEQNSIISMIDDIKILSVEKRFDIIEKDGRRYILISKRHE